MYIKIDELQEGYIVQEDVMGKTSCPLISKGTVLTNRHIQFLKAFLIDEIEVEGEGVPVLQLSGEEKHAEPQEFNTERPVISNEEDFFDQFNQKEKRLKKEFQKWQSGMGIEMPAVRQMILPLLEQVLANPDLCIKLHKCGNEAYDYHHPLATALLSAGIASQLHYEKGTVIQAALAGLLADCGLAKLHPRLLAKQESKEFKAHPLYSYNMVKELSLLKSDAKLAILQHHERLDGSGYPRGDRGDQVNALSRIIAVADTFHAMTAQTTADKRYPAFKALEMLKEDYFGKFDLTAVKALTALFTKISPGTEVELSNGQRGSILFMKQNQPTRPLVQIHENSTIVDLEKRRDLYIKEVR
ncbi:HD-GYP domain-containing protein [Bacillus xiapuensis]|uniref:HD-GYP domain-containing protein n=1 Tax=Bacillus xiapuensis TaxID=2014075 RepID=UPI000C23E9A5|nr:HD domain-containing phosphohydrolase [Bacillus xiapuensis]